MFSKFFPPKDRAIYEIMLKNLVEPERPQVAIWLHVACWISTATRAQTRPLPCTHTRARIHRNMLLLFHGNSGFVNAPECYVINTLLVCNV